MRAQKTKAPRKEGICLKQRLSQAEFLLSPKVRDKVNNVGNLGLMK